MVEDLNSGLHNLNTPKKLKILIRNYKILLMYFVHLFFCFVSCCFFYIGPFTLYCGFYGIRKSTNNVIFTNTYFEQIADLKKYICVWEPEKHISKSCISS